MTALLLFLLFSALDTFGFLPRKRTLQWDATGPVRLTTLNCLFYDVRSLFFCLVALAGLMLGLIDFLNGQRFVGTVSLGVFFVSSIYAVCCARYTLNRLRVADDQASARS